MRSDMTTLVLCGTGKTGGRVVERLMARGVGTRVGSRSGVPPFDWDDSDSWEHVLRGVDSVFVAYFPDMAFPGAADTVSRFARQAVESGVRRMVLLSRRGEEGSAKGEHAVRGAGAEWTIVRASWLSQCFSESHLLQPMLGGEVALPARQVGEPFVDADDVADVAVAALTEDGHAGRVYEVTGPRLLTFAEAVEEVAEATGREIRYVRVPVDEFGSLLGQRRVPPVHNSLLRYLFTVVLDGRNARLADGVERALGREPRDFADFARAAAASGVWSARR
jgi:uncharacterized protein YbjT (DUF2867 family)